MATAIIDNNCKFTLDIVVHGCCNHWIILNYNLIVYMTTAIIDDNYDYMGCWCIWLLQLLIIIVIYIGCWCVWLLQSLIIIINYMTLFLIRGMKSPLIYAYHNYCKCCIYMVIILFISDHTYHIYWNRKLCNLQLKTSI